MENGELSKKFLAYYLNQSSFDNALKTTIAKNLEIDESMLKEFNRKRRSDVFQGVRGMEILTEEERASLSDIPNDLIEKWKKEQFGMKTEPGSKDAQRLFTLAGLSMNPSLSIDFITFYDMNLHESYDEQMIETLDHEE